MTFAPQPTRNLQSMFLSQVCYTFRFDYIRHSDNFFSSYMLIFIISFFKSRREIFFADAELKLSYLKLVPSIYYIYICFIDLKGGWGSFSARRAYII